MNHATANPVPHATRVYWANSFFSEADRAFNTQCVRLLRQHGFDVFSPQEGGFNLLKEIRSDVIFDNDTRAIREAAALVACIDQETVDCGVACEVGYAYAIGVPVLGIYTDLRQFRVGDGRMYKNPFVVGCILARGEIITDIRDLPDALSRTLGHHDRTTPSD